MPYFDHNATTQLASVAREAWLAANDDAWQNPSSPYRGAARSHARLEQAREHLARLLGCAKDLVVFCSGATEAAHSILGYLAVTLPPDKKLLLNPTEHPCVLAAAQKYFADRISWLELKDGVVRIDSIETLLASGGIGALVAMAANNETGVIQPWRELAALSKKTRVPYVCDASQWLGKLPASGLGELDWIFGAAHKFGGPKGTGVLKIAPQAQGFRSLPGGEQEHGHRGGTENFPGIAAMVAALDDAETRKVFLETERLNLRKTFEQNVRRALPGLRIVAGESERLWNTVSLIMPHTENHRWVARLDQLGFQVSTGSACATGKQASSHVLAAMGFSPDEARRVIRVSAGWETTADDWRQLADAFAKVDVDLKAGTSPDVIRL